MNTSGVRVANSASEGSSPAGRSELPPRQAQESEHPHDRLGKGRCRVLHPRGGLAVAAVPRAFDVHPAAGKQPSAQAGQGARQQQEAHAEDGDEAKRSRAGAEPVCDIRLGNHGDRRNHGAHPADQQGAGKPAQDTGCAEENHGYAHQGSAFMRSASLVVPGFAEEDDSERLGETCGRQPADEGQSRDDQQSREPPGMTAAAEEDL